MTGERMEQKTRGNITILYTKLVLTSEHCRARTSPLSRRESCSHNENNDNDESDDEEDVLEFYSGVMDQLHQILFQNIEDPSVKKWERGCYQRAQSE